MTHRAQPRVFLFEEEMLAAQAVAAEADVLPLLAGAWTPSEAGRQVYLAAIALGPGLDASDMAAALAAAGHSVVVRRGLGTPRTPENAASNLRNEFVVVTRLASGNGPLPQEILLEPSFRSHFELAAGSSLRYASLLASLPTVFAGPARELAALVRLLAAHMALEYQRLGRDVPPWRTAAALQSLWAPANTEDHLPAGVLQRSSDSSGSGSLWGSSAAGSPFGSPVSVLTFWESGVNVKAVAPVVKSVVFGFDVPAALVVPPVGVKSVVFGFEVAPVAAVQAVEVGGVKKGMEERDDTRRQDSAPAAVKPSVRKADMGKVGELLPQVFSVQMTPKWVA